MKMSEKPIINVGYGLSSSYDDGIEINRKLTGELREKILKHERMHRNKHYSRADLKNDFNSKNPYIKESMLWAFKNPESLVGFMPFMWSYYYKIMTFNWSATIPFLYFGGIFTLFWWIIFKINPLLTIICYLAIIFILNVLLMLLTHYIIKKSGLDY